MTKAKKSNKQLCPNMDILTEPIETFKMDFDLDWNIFNEDITPAVCIKTNNKHEMRRYFSEVSLMDAMDSIILQEGYSYHLLTGGNIDSLTFLRLILRQHKLDYVLFSTWCMAKEDIKEIDNWIKGGKIKKIDAYVGEIFTKTYSKEYALLKPIIEQTNGRVCMFKNHAKIYVGCNVSDDFYFAIESSANINTNPRTENTTIHISRPLYDFYKNYFDGIKPFNRDCNPNWKAFK